MWTYFVSDIRVIFLEGGNLEGGVVDFDYNRLEPSCREVVGLDLLCAEQLLL